MNDHFKTIITLTRCQTKNELYFILVADKILSKENNSSIYFILFLEIGILFSHESFTLVKEFIEIDLLSLVASSILFMRLVIPIIAITSESFEIWPCMSLWWNIDPMLERSVNKFQWILWRWMRFNPRCNLKAKPTRLFLKMWLFSIQTRKRNLTLN